MKRYSIPAMFAALAILVSPACADNHAETAPQFIKTSNGASFDTDFTVAAENTVNMVVCIKSFTNQRQNPYGNQGEATTRLACSNSSSGRNLASNSLANSNAIANPYRAVWDRVSLYQPTDISSPTTTSSMEQTNSKCF